MSVALLNEPIEAELMGYRPHPSGEAGRRVFDAIAQVLMLGVEIDAAGEHYALFITEDGFLSSEQLSLIRTKFRWDKDLQDWMDTGEPEVTDPDEG